MMLAIHIVRYHVLDTGATGAPDQVRASADRVPIRDLGVDAACFAGAILDNVGDESRKLLCSKRTASILRDEALSFSPRVVLAASRQPPDRLRNPDRRACLKGIHPNR
jgi:hypothetical protein